MKAENLNAIQTAKGKTALEKVAEILRAEKTAIDTREKENSKKDFIFTIKSVLVVERENVNKEMAKHFKVTEQEYKDILLKAVDESKAFKLYNSIVKDVLSNSNAFKVVSDYKEAIAKMETETQQKL